ncbi:hypothetical protein [Pontibacter sp. G13]|uniref:hypothetical protein n=1 Tax=Pontibacter sp. G13 TaxID=3074898 RepID=UPI00288A8003|nr:hypothetical protein [Pontibacter sp. G13]WNJ18658.1 hypothetical protein RJD25_27700 [Pontibacter sp. G13]
MWKDDRKLRDIRQEMACQIRKTEMYLNLEYRQLWAVFLLVEEEIGGCMDFR